MKGIWRWLVFLLIIAASWWMGAHMSSPFTRVVLGIPLALFLYTRHWLIVQVWNGLFGQSTDLLLPDVHGWAWIPAWIFAISFNWIFWSVLISRSLKLVGLWDPFPVSNIYGWRPWVLKTIVFIGGWWEILTKFGRPGHWWLCRADRSAVLSLQRWGRFPRPSPVQNRRWDASADRSSD